VTDNPHFRTVASWDDARPLLVFAPVRPSEAAGGALESLRIHVRDHKQRELAVAARSLEAHYGTFVFTQAWRGQAEARRQTLEVSYGLAGYPASVLGRPGRAYDLGPDVPPDDVDGRSPAVFAWADGELFLLLASTVLDSQTLIRIATSVHASARHVSR
jgi:hypothetical protein